LPKFTRLGSRFGFIIYLFFHKQKSFGISKLPNCERNSLKSFINILKAYELNQQRESNIKVVKSFKLETKALAYHPKQGGHLRIAKEEL
jgi:hypothetical protein